MYFYRYILPVIFLGIGISAQAATDVSGSLLADTTWDTAGSPYTVSGDITLYPSYTLMIEPGVAVVIAEGVDLDIRGVLDINGTEAEPVTITGSVEPTSNWNNTSADGIRINADQGGSLSATYLQISHLHTAFQVDCCYTSGLTFTITDSVFSDNTVGLFVYDGPNTVVVERSTFQNNTFAVKGVDTSISESTFSGNTYGLHYTSGVNVTCSEFNDNAQGITSASSATLSYSTLTNNTVALDDPWSSFTITNNAITDNETGLYTESSGTSFTNNNIYNNTTWNVRNGTTSSQVLDSNWWNTTVVNDIAATIYDGIDQSGLGLVTIEPVLTAGVNSSVGCAAEDDVDVTPPAEVTLGLVQKDPWNKTITLNWTNPTDTDFDHVIIKRTDRFGTEVTLTETETGTTYTDSSINYGMKYTYTLSTVDTTGNVSASVTTNSKRVKRPTVRHLHLRARDAAIVARWERLPLRLNPAVGYLVYYGTSPDDLTISIDVGDTTIVTIPELTFGERYYVSVAAYNGDGVEGPMSMIKSIQL